jgi:hypothetical protein
MPSFSTGDGGWFDAPIFDANDFGNYSFDQGFGGDAGAAPKTGWGYIGHGQGDIYDHLRLPMLGGASSNYEIMPNAGNNSFQMNIKSGPKAGSQLNYNLVNGQYVPDQTVGGFEWDTNFGSQNKALAIVAGGALGGAAMGAMAPAAGAGAAAPAVGTAAGTTGGMGPWAGMGGMAGGGFGAGEAGLGALGAAGAAGGVGGAGSAGGAAGGASGGLGGLGSAMPSSWGDWLSTIGGVGGALNNWLPIAGAIGGALEGNQDTTTSSGPPDYLRNAGAAAAAIPFQPYGGAPPQYSQNPMFGMDNPYLQKQIDAATGDIKKNFDQTTRPMLDAMNSRANTGFGTSSSMDEMRGTAYEGLNKQLGQVSNDMRFKDYYNQSQLGEGNAARQNAFGQHQQGFDYNEFLRSQQYPDVQLGRLGVGNPNVNTTPGAGWLQGAIGGYMGGLGAQGMIGGAQSQQPPIRTDQFYNSIYGFGDDTAWGRN